MANGKSKNKPKKEYDPSRWIKPAQPFLNGDIAIRIDGKYIPIYLKEKIESHSERVWIFFDDFPEEPVRITLHKERSGFLKVLETIKNLYVETHSQDPKHRKRKKGDHSHE